MGPLSHEDCRCTITGEVVSPCYLYPRDATAAAAGSELLQLDDWMADKAPFPRRHGIRRDMVIDLCWASAATHRLRQYERDFHRAITVQANLP